MIVPFSSAFPQSGFARFHPNSCSPSHVDFFFRTLCLARVSFLRPLCPRRFSETFFPRYRAGCFFDSVTRFQLAAMAESPRFVTTLAALSPILSFDQRSLCSWGRPSRYSSGSLAGTLSGATRPFTSPLIPKKEMNLQVRAICAARMVPLSFATAYTSFCSLYLACTEVVFS